MNVPEKADQGSRRFRNIKLCIFFSGLSVFAQLYLFQPMLPM
ncbi:MAG TPA: MFS transporter, partial [Chryseobacterium indologenes]|nr:MFS transporter [Chryseobacterium indologenes]